MRSNGHWNTGGQTLTEFARPSSFGGSYLGSYGTQEDDFDIAELVFKSTIWPPYYVDYRFEQLEIIEEINTIKLIKKIILL